MLNRSRECKMLDSTHYITVEDEEVHTIEPDGWWDVQENYHSPGTIKRVSESDLTEQPQDIEKRRVYFSNGQRHDRRIIQARKLGDELVGCIIFDGVELPVHFTGKRWEVNAY